MPSIPRYALVGDRPVKAIYNEEDRMVVLAWDWERRVFDLAPEYFDKLFIPGSPEIEVLTEEAFQEKVDDLLFAS